MQPLLPPMSHPYTRPDQPFRAIRGPHSRSVPGCCLRAAGPPAHRFLNQMVGVTTSPSEELGVVAEQHLNALPGPASALGGIDAGRQPCPPGCDRDGRRAPRRSVRCVRAARRRTTVVSGPAGWPWPHAVQGVDFIGTPVVRPLLTRCDRATSGVEQAPAGRRGRSTALLRGGSPRPAAWRRSTCNRRMRADEGLVPAVRRPLPAAWPPAPDSAHSRDPLRRRPPAHPSQTPDEREAFGSRARR